MTKKPKSSKSNEIESRPFRFQSLHERLNNININVVHRIRYHDDLTSLEQHDDLIRTSHFHQSLEHWSALNFSEAFSKLHDNLRSLSGSLEQVVFNREQIVAYLRQTLNEQNPLINETLLDLIVQLARDLQGDFYAYYKEFLFVDIINLLLSSKAKQQQQHEINTQLLEQVFQCLTYLFKYLWRIMLKDLANLYELYSKYLFSPLALTTNFEYIRSFAAESFAYLLRKIENYQPFIDYLFSRTEITDDELESLGLVFAETCQNVQSTFHSCTRNLLTCLLNQFLVKPELLQSTIKTIFRLLIEHTNKQNCSTISTCFFDVFHSINQQQSIDTLVYLTFYEIFQLFLQHKMIDDWNICSQFLTSVQSNTDEQFVKIHYQTVWKLMKIFPIKKDILDIYYRFSDQTPISLLCEEMQQIFQDKFYEKLPNEFSIRFWTYLFEKQTNQQDFLDFVIEFILTQRQKSQMIIYSTDTNETILEKIDLLKTKSQFVTQDQFPTEVREKLQTFIQTSLSNLTNPEYLTNGTIWKALVVQHSLSNSSFSIPTNHHHQFEQQLIEHCLKSNQMIPLILIELVTYSHSFSSTFFYSILEKHVSFEFILLSTRLAFLLRKPITTDFDRFVNLLKDNLSSFQSTIRLLTLEILCSFELNENHPLNNCLRCEQSPLNVYEYRSKIVHLQKLSVEFLLANNYSSCLHLSMYYLLGLLSTNFTPLWSIVIELVGSYGNKAIESIGHNCFWSILNEKFQLIKRKSIETTIVNENQWIRKYFRVDHNDEAINSIVDYNQYRINLFQILSCFPNECENKTKLVFPIVFEFFADEYYDQLLAIGLLNRNKQSYEIEQITTKRLTKKSSLKTMESILKCLKQFRHPKQWFEPERLYNFYKRLLLSTDISVQQLAYQCLLTCTQVPQTEIHSDFLAHSENLMPIFNPSTARKTFHELFQGVLVDSNLSDSIKYQYGFVLIRLLYSKLNTKRALGSTTRGRKDYFELNRKYLFQFLITFASNEFYHPLFEYFIQLIVEPFQDELKSNDYLQMFNEKIQFNSNKEFHLTSYEIFLKYLQHSLGLLKTFLAKLRVYVFHQMNSIVKFYLLTILFLDYLTQQTDSSIEAKRLRILIKRLRSMSYKGLQIICQLFDQDEQNHFDQQLIDDIWLCSVEKTFLNANKERQDLVHLLKLTNIWSSTNILKQQFLDNRSSSQQLVQCFIQLLTENITNQNKQLIIEFIWNILQINPNDPLLSSYNDQLLAYLTNISSSMIDGKSSISLTPKEFDILLVLSQKQLSIDKIEQLCSIFIRLLRQNILGKKKKKTVGENFNIVILQILQNLTKNLTNPIDKYLHLLSILSAKIIQRDQRIEFVRFIQVLIDQSATMSADTLWYLKQFIELNSWSSDQVDEPDYERRLNSYKQLTSRIANLTESDGDKPECLCLFYHCLYELHHSRNDLSLREYSSEILRLFLRQITSYERLFLSEIRSILKQPSINMDIRFEYIRHLAYLIDRNSSQNCDLTDLKRLRDYQDAEVDFFNNITHVQTHRRLRALKRLKSIHLENEFQLSTITNYLLPIISSFVTDVLNEQIDDIHDEIVFLCLTIFTQKLPWMKYNQLFISFFRQLISTKKTYSLVQKRCLTKTISAIIDGFHFQLDNTAESDRIRQTIEKRLFPMILNLLSENSFSIDSLTNQLATKNASIEEQRQQAVLLTVTCALISIKLLAIFPSEYIEQHLSTVILHLITLLRSRIYSIRDQARDCLCKCITILGKRYLKFILEEIIAGLQRGYQQFVLLHTIHNILIHISNLEIDFNIDSSVQVIVNLFTEDFFNQEKTESAKANEHENSSYKPSSIPEAKTNKTANVFELLGKLIRSNEQLFHCVEPLRQQLFSNSDSRQITKCEKCLQRFQSGLISNTNLSLETLLTFIYHLLTKTDENIDEDKQTNTKKPLNSIEKIVEERNQYHLVPAEPKRGLARVAQAIKLTKKTNIHCLISWTLNLLHKLIKKSKTNGDDFLSMIDPFVDHIEKCLNSPYTDVIVSSLRNLSSILEYSLPSLTKQRVTNLYKKVFDLLKLYSSIAGSNDLNDLLTLSYKILGLFVQRSVNDQVQLTSDEYQCLFTYIESDLLNTHRQSSAFLLLRSIMRHSVSIISNDKLLRQQIDELLRARLIFLIVQSPFEHVRSTCRELFHLYLFSYEHTKAKLKSYFDFFLLQLDYEDFNGRLSVLIFLQNLFNDLTKQRLNDYAAYFFLPLACHFYNETNSECKKQFQLDLKLLLEKIDQQHRNDILKNIIFSWFDDQIEHRCLALQLFILLIEIDKEQFDQYLVEVFDFIRKELTNIQSDDVDDEQQKFNDQYIYHLINVIIFVLKFCPNSLQMSQLRLKWLDLLKLIDEKCLLHAHIWVRFLSAQVFGLIFESQQVDEIVLKFKNHLTEQENNSTAENGPTRKRQKRSALDQEPLLVHYAVSYDSSVSPLKKIQRLCLGSCSQLKPSNLSDEFTLQIIKNLLYLSKILLLSNSNHIDLIIRRCCRLTTFESTKYPNEITRRSAVLKWMAGLIVDLSGLLTDHLKAFLTVIEREIERDETTVNLPLKSLAQDVFDVFKRHCDIHLIASLYADIAKQRRAKRVERKQKLAILAINQPEVVYRKKRVKQTKRAGLGKKKRMKSIENAKKNRRKKVMKNTTDDNDDF